MAQWKATAADALEASQVIFSHKDAFADYAQDIGLAASTDINFVSQLVLKNKAPGPILASPTLEAEMREKLAAYEAFQKVARADPAYSWLSVIIDAVVVAIKAWLATLKTT